MPKVNTITQLILFFIFALTLNLWYLNALFILMFILLMVLIYLKNEHFYRLMSRLKWFYLVMFLIFLFNTPGEHIPRWPFGLKPTYEGLQSGSEQVLRITLMLAALSLVLIQNTKQQLISGLYFLLKPLSRIGIDVQRFAARLWLTLHYVELHQSNKENKPLTGGLAQSLSDMFEDAEDDDVEINLENPVQTWVDYSVISITLVILLVAFSWSGL